MLSNKKIKKKDLFEAILMAKLNFNFDYVFSVYKIRVF